ncbi:hypothetical protein OV203_14440 [Nannocystis sp. ILAH1]|uniref:hypothetical protein n=1 Tax=unclassified Nannocystis TaxID=2627009 RepID=UPI00226E2E1D|nr:MULTISPECIES: hypothetical protein [unclassified Nannocystis]MCY0988327.1 hypothetical protein [Nannocystis sp. ILAH1]MCY1067712.1 hypothetical protein [Nannocystis sp. RBIL2]
MPRRILLTFIAAVACSSEAGKPAQPAPTSVVQPYVTIQETLAADRLDKLSELSAQVVVAADPLQTEAGIPEVVAGAGRVAAQDIDTARAGFEKMSMGLISYLKAHSDQRAGYEVVFCPMAFNNKGAYWVQKTGEIINPYHGMMMLHCGDKVAWDKAPG